MRTWAVIDAGLVRVKFVLPTVVKERSVKAPLGVVVPPVAVTEPELCD
jgi:hypothetical protein